MTLLALKFLSILIDAINVILFHFQQFQKLNFPFTTVELENRDDCNQIQAVLGELTGATTVSIIQMILSNRKSRISSFDCLSAILKVEEGQTEVFFCL